MVSAGAAGEQGGLPPPNQDPQSYTARNDGDDGTVHITSCHLTHSLTHSPVNLPRWGLATAEDHSDIFLLHCARSCEIFSWMYSQPVHSSMLCIHCLLSLPWCRNPSMIPSRTVSANCPALPRVMWPKYCTLCFKKKFTLLLYAITKSNVDRFQ